MEDIRREKLEDMANENRLDQMLSSNFEVFLSYYNPNLIDINDDILKFSKLCKSFGYEISYNDVIDLLKEI